MTLLRKVINLTVGRVGNENNDTDLLHPAFTTFKREVQCLERKYIFPCGELKRIAKMLHELFYQTSRQLMSRVRLGFVC